MKRVILRKTSLNILLTIIASVNIIKIDLDILLRPRRREKNRSIPFPSLSLSRYLSWLISDDFLVMKEFFFVCYRWNFHPNDRLCLMWISFVCLCLLKMIVSLCLLSNETSEVMIEHVQIVVYVYLRKEFFECTICSLSCDC